MRLKHYTDGYFCDYNPNKAAINPESVEHIDYNVSFDDYMTNRTDVGYCIKMPCGWVALYASEDGLILQIDRKKWTLTSDNVTTSYMHDFRTKRKMMFRIKDPDSEFNISYDRWWKKTEDNLVDPVYASKDRDNVDSDLLAYVDHLKMGDGHLENVLTSWNENL